MSPALSITEVVQQTKVSTSGMLVWKDNMAAVVPSRVGNSPLLVSKDAEYDNPSEDPDYKIMQRPTGCWAFTTTDDYEFTNPEYTFETLEDGLTVLALQGYAYYY
jgi:hypothetical protein